MAQPQSPPPCIPPALTLGTSLATGAVSPPPPSCPRNPPLPQARTFQILQLHTELFCTLYGKQRKFVQGMAGHTHMAVINPQRLLEMWDYEGSLSEHVRLGACVTATRVWASINGWSFCGL